MNRLIVSLIVVVVLSLSPLAFVVQACPRGSTCVGKDQKSPVTKRSSLRKLAQARRRAPAPKAQVNVTVGWLLLGLGAAIAASSSVMFGIAAQQNNELIKARDAHKQGDCDLIKDKSESGWGACANSLQVLLTQQNDYNAFSGATMGVFATGIAVLLVGAVVLGLPPKAPNKAAKATKTPGKSVLLQLGQ